MAHTEMMRKFMFFCKTLQIVPCLNLTTRPEPRLEGQLERHSLNPLSAPTTWQFVAQVMLLLLLFFDKLTTTGKLSMSLTSTLSIEKTLHLVKLI